MRKKIKILIVEDEVIIANDIKMSVENFGYYVTAVEGDGETVLKRIKETKPDLVLVDIKLNGDLNGIELTDIIQKEYNIPVIYVTAYTNEKTIQDAKLTAPYGFINKPFEDRELYATIEMAIFRFKLDQQIIEEKQKIEILHDVAMELMECETKRSIFSILGKALVAVFGISDFVFYQRELDDLINISEKSLKHFKPIYSVNEGIIGNIFCSNEICIFSTKKDIIEIEPNWQDIGSAIGSRIGHETVFAAVNKDENAYHEDVLVKTLLILFNHADESLKRLEYEEMLKKKAVIDPLTNVFNRLYYNQAIKYEVKLAKRYGNDIGFIVVDINNLKYINDTFGHNKGDAAIQFVASLLVSQARETDNIIRSGGDEFLIMLPQTGKEVEIVENRLRKAIVKANEKSELSFPVSFAIGSSYWNTEMKKSVEESIEEADQKMYIDKQNSKKNR